jgi:hypothetical protein
MTSKITVNIPTGREKCATWICAQEPNVVADALGITETAYHAMVQGINSAEEDKRLQALHLKTNELKRRMEEVQTQLQEERESAHTERQKQLNAWQSEQKHTIDLLQHNHNVQLEEIERSASKRRLQVEQQVQNLETELALQRGKELKYKDEVRQQYEERLSLERAAWKDEEKKLSQALKEQDVQFEVRIQEMRCSLKDQLGQNEKHIEWLRVQLETKDTQIQIEKSEQLRISTEFAERLERAGVAQREALCSLKGSSILGIIGENLVYEIHSRLEMGTLVDTRHSSETGTEDYTWNHCPAFSGELRCSYEVKNSQKLHSIHDIKKHEDRIYEAVAAGRINAAIFMSLRCRIPNRKSIELDTLCGIPVLYISRESNESEVSASALIELSFRMMSQLWPFMWKSKSRGATDFAEALRSISGLLSHHKDQLQSLTKQIDELTKTGNGILKASERLRKVRDGMIAGIKHVEDAHSEALCADQPAEACEPTNPEEALETALQRPETEILLQAIAAYNDKYKRYPKKMTTIKFPNAQVPNEIIDELASNGLTLDKLNEHVQKRAQCKRNSIALEKNNEEQSKRQKTESVA